MSSYYFSGFVSQDGKETGNFSVSAKTPSELNHVSISGAAVERADQRFTSRFYLGPKSVFELNPGPIEPIPVPTGIPNLPPIAEPIPPLKKK